MPVKFTDCPCDAAMDMLPGIKEDVLWVGLRTVDAQLLDAVPNCRIVVTPCTGLDHIDLAECERRGIEVISLNGDTEFLQTIPATAELTIGLILSLLRRIPAAVGGRNRDDFRGNDLSGKAVGIVGYGRVGRQVGRILSAFGCSRYVTNNFSAFEHLGKCDIVTVHVDLNDQTRGMFDADAFRRMKPGAWFVNTSRGEVVDEAALLDALESGHLAGAALDVVCNERGERNQKLVDYARRFPERLLISPHIAGNTIESRRRTDIRIAERLREHLLTLQQPCGSISSDN